MAGPLLTFLLTWSADRVAGSRVEHELSHSAGGDALATRMARSFEAALRRDCERHDVLDRLGVALDVAVEDGDVDGRREREAVALRLAEQGDLLALVLELALVVLGHEAVARVLVVPDQ